MLDYSDDSSTLPLLKSKPNMKRKIQFKRYSLLFLLVGLLGVMLILFFLLSDSGEKEDIEVGDALCYYCPEPQIPLGSICSPSEIRTFQKYAVSTDSNVCAHAGKDILKKNGNAVDAVIAVLLCMGVTIPESLGLGGGSLILIYNKTSDSASYVVAREIAPLGSSRDMFNSSGSDPKGSSFGLQAIAVPGEVAGYWHIFNKYGSGNIKWEELFEWAIKYARDGFPVGEHLNDALKQIRDKIINLKTLRNVYVNSTTGDLFKTNEIFKQPILAKTLTRLSKSSNGHDFFYKTISQEIINDLKNHSDFPKKNFLITMKDFQNYEIIDEPAHSVKLRDNITLYTAALPGSGNVLSFILRVMLNQKWNDLYPDARTDFNKTVLFYHRLMETFKFAYSRRMYLGDDRFDNVTLVLANLTSDRYINEVISKIDDSKTYPSDHYGSKSFQNFDHGTAHVSVMDSLGNVVAVTSTVNSYFGSKVMSPSTGIIMNNQMDDFNIGKLNDFNISISYANAIHPNKRPLSSMVPSVFVDQHGPRLAIGASGGPKITTSVALTVLRHLWLNDNIKQAIDSSRLHHQLYPINVENEQCFPEKVLTNLVNKNHVVKQLAKGVRGAVVMAISRSPDGKIQANSDYRKGGTIDGE